MRVDAAAAGSQRNPARASLRAEQHHLIAAAYQKAARADMSLPGHPERHLLEKLTGFVCLASLEKSKNLRHCLRMTPTKKPTNHCRIRFGSGDSKLKAMKVGT
jgi:hypothetical protein